MFGLARDLIIGNRFYDYNEYRLKSFVKRIANMCPPGSSLLDVGAGQTQYKKYFSHLSYTAQDSGVGDASWDFSRIDIVSEIYDIPLPKASFDYILCTQVMEHLAHPDKAFVEFERLLKHGGTLFVTCPMTWKEHQKPHDFYRYTQFALSRLGEDHGFKVLEMNKVGGKFITIAKLITDLNVLQAIRNKWLLRFCLLILYPLNWLIGCIGYLLDPLDTTKDLTLQYECIFEKIS